MAYLENKYSIVYCMMQFAIKSNELEVFTLHVADLFDQQ
jgi:hypothetical protein